jgi:hypothetical protein
MATGIVPAITIRPIPARATATAKAAARASQSERNQSMSMTGLLLGVINIAIVIAILLLIGAIIVWFCSFMQIAVPEQVRKGYIIVVALIGLYMIVALLVGMPTVRIIAG